MADEEIARRDGDGEAWRRWGPYLSERAWGTVREDYSPDGEAWSHFPHDQARSRVYRWSEDGLGGICDEEQLLCMAFAFWNGRDPILKERIFGLTGDEGNHGEDAKEYWWYLDSTPTHSWMRWRYMYPQGEFPYEELLEVNRARGRDEPEYELLDTGLFDEDRYWDITVDYAKAGPDDICMRVRVRNAGPEAATLHVLPHLWFRNRWSWDTTSTRPEIELDDGMLTAHEPELGPMSLRGDGAPEALFCHNQSNTERLWSHPGDPFPKDGINDHVVHGRATVNPEHTGTKAALWYRLEVPAGETGEIRLRLAPDPDDLEAGWSQTMTARLAEADEFYAGIAPAATPDETHVMRQAFAGMLWSKQFYHYDVARWLDGDPAGPPPPAERLTGRNHKWRHLSNRRVISMPDKWEYPWYAAWDLSFHCVTLARVDPEFAKEQLRLITREWYMHANGQLPAYEWDFGDVNPPVHAQAALQVFRADGARDVAWLKRIFHKMLLGFTWWANTKDIGGDNLFGGGFLGLDNIGPFDRSKPLADGHILEQADGTGWMGLFCLNMLEIALVLSEHDTAYEDVAVKFFEHFTHIQRAINDRGLWDEADGFYYDQIARESDGARWPVRARSMTGFIPMYAVAVGDGRVMRELDDFPQRVRDFLRVRPEMAAAISLETKGDRQSILLAMVGLDRLPRLIERLGDTEEFLSPHGVRALSAAYRGRPFEIWENGQVVSTVDYEPAESTIPLFGGNSNWRGPIWFPVNVLLITALHNYQQHVGDDYTLEYPRGSGAQCTLREIAHDLASRLISIFLPGEDGRRPVFGDLERFQTDPAWRDNLLFHEYFHGDNGAGLGASHQTGWTGLVANLIIHQASLREQPET